MLEVDVKPVGDVGDGATDLVNPGAEATARLESPVGGDSSPPPPTDADANGVVPASKPPGDEDALPPRSLDWPPYNNNCIRIKPEVLAKPAQNVCSPDDVSTALAGVHEVLQRIDSVARQQQVVGDVIVQLQVLRCRLQLAQVTIRAAVSINCRKPSNHYSMGCKNRFTPTVFMARFHDRCWLPLHAIHRHVR